MANGKPIDVSLASMHIGNTADKAQGKHLHLKSPCLPVTKLTLMTLPQEIRDMILEYSMYSKHPFDEKWWYCTARLRSTTRVCRQLRAESWPVFFKMNQFQVPAGVCYSKELSRAFPPGEYLRSKVQHVLVDFADHATRHTRILFRGDSKEPIESMVPILRGNLVEYRFENLKTITIALEHDHWLAKKPVRLAKRLRPIGEFAKRIHIIGLEEKVCQTVEELIAGERENDT